MRATRHLSVVMYHYVRPIAQSRYPGIKGLEIADFRLQLDHFQEKYHVVDLPTVLAALRGDTELPTGALLLTFDDGYRDHYDHVLPCLLERGLSGVFFPPVQAIRDRRALAVNKIHFVLISCAEPAGLLTSMKDLLAERDDVPEEFDAWWSELEVRYGHPNRFDTPEVSLAKRLLQFGLPRAARRACVDHLFEEFVSIPEREFVDALYMTPIEVAALLAQGMSVGSHGFGHGWLDRMSDEEQAEDMRKADAFLGVLGIPRHERTFCYPYGGYNAESVRLLNEMGYAASFTTRPAHFHLDPTLAQEIPRFDTNDFVPVASQDPSAP